MLSRFWTRKSVKECATETFTPVPKFFPLDTFDQEWVEILREWDTTLSGSTTLYLWGPTGSGKTHIILVSSQGVFTFTYHTVLSPSHITRCVHLHTLYGLNYCFRLSTEENVEWCHPRKQLSSIRGNLLQLLSSMTWI